MFTRATTLARWRRFGRKLRGAVAEMGGHKFTIRAAEVEEAPAVLTLWRRSGATVGSTDDVPSILTLIRGWPGSLLVATSGPEIVGSIIATFDGWRGNLYRLVVDPAFRRTGLGSHLVAEA